MLRKWIFCTLVIFTFSLPALANLVVVPEQVQGFKGASLEKLELAFEVFEAVINSDEFKQRVLNFRNAAGQRAFASNNGLTNEQVYAALMEGRETRLPSTVGEANLYLKLYNRPWSKVIGWTNGDINTIHINWKFFKKFHPEDVAGNLVHEWTHKLGFGHRSAKEHDSVPYGVGYIVRDLGERYLRGEAIR